MVSERSSKVLKKLLIKYHFILLPIDDHQYIHLYRIKQSLNKSLKNFKEIETCVNINALKLIYTRFKKGSFNLWFVIPCWTSFKK